MSRKRLTYHGISLAILTIPNLLYLGINFEVFKEANAISLTMTALLMLSIVGIGAATHVKVNGGIWAVLIGILILSLSNIAYIAGIALIIEGGGVAIDGYVFKPLIEKEKALDLEKEKIKLQKGMMNHGSSDEQSEQDTI